MRRQLVDRWLDLAMVSAEADPERGDRAMVAVATERRTGIPRKVACGAIIDGRADNPGVLVFSLTYDLLDGTELLQELGVSTRAHAQVVVDALFAAWPDLRAP